MDTIVFEVVRSSLYAIAREMKAAVMRTAASPIIHDGGDASACVFNADMCLVAQGNDVPTMLGSSVLSVRAAVTAIGVENLRPGDVIISNDAYLAAGNHQPDVQFTRPVFYDGKIIAYVMTKGHWLDIGGQTPGSHNISSWDIFGEGIRIPPMLLYRNDEPRRDVVELLVLNTRDPGSRRLDIDAQYAGTFVGDKRLQSLIGKYGAETIAAAMARTLEHSEKLMRRRIAAVPDGVYTAEDWIEPVAVEGWKQDLIPVRVKITKSGETMHFDYEGTGAQVRGGINAPYAVACNTTWFAVKVLLGEGIPINEGCYRPITIDVPEGTILNCKYPAAVVGGNTETSPRVVDLLFQALSQALPKRALADSSAAACALTFSGSDPDQARCALLGRDYVNYMDVVPGGLGARPDSDGVSAIRVHVGNTGYQSVEMVESVFPVLLEEWQLVPDTGGPGQFRGGLPSQRTYLVEFDEATFSIIGERERVAPKGRFGGLDGTRFQGTVRRTSGQEEKISAKGRATVVQKGDRITIRSPGSGGYGAPTDRDRDAILDDILNGYVSEAQAEQIFGLKLRESAA